ncbi:MAG: hypothetical protein QM760_00625 [Nibricoccus sp.]
MAALALAGLFNSQLTAAPVAVSTVDAAERSAHFDVVNGRLELGGVLYGYMDIDGDVVKLADFLSEATGKVAEVNPMLGIAQQNYAQIFDELGLTGVKAIGLSSVRDGEGFRNRVFLYTSGGRRGVLALVGGDAKPFANTRLAPAGTDLFCETELDVPSAYAALRAVVVRIGGDGLANMLESELKKPTPAGVTPQEVIQQLSGRYTLIARLDTEQPVDLPNGMSIPGVSALLKLDGMAPVFRKLIKPNNDLVEVTDGGRTFFEVNEAMPGTTLKPVFLFEGDAFVVASTRAFAFECLDRKSGGLDGQADFQKALASVGTSGNGLSYVTPRLLSEIRKVIDSATQSNPQLASLGDFWGRFLPETSKPLVSVRANLPEGILIRSYSYRSLKQEVLFGANGPVTIGMLSAMAIPAFQKVRDNSQEKTIQNNLRQFQAAAQQHMLEHNKTSASYADVVGPEEGKYIRQLTPVLGEDYTSLVLKDSDTEISVTTADGKVISQKVY